MSYPKKQKPNPRARILPDEVFPARPRNLQQFVGIVLILEADKFVGAAISFSGDICLHIAIGPFNISSDIESVSRCFRDG
jgi:hypothetical protein